MFNNIRTRRKGLLLLTTAAALLTGFIGYLLMYRLQTESVQSIQHSIEPLRITLTVIRWSLIALVTGCWNHLIAWMAKAGLIKQDKMEQLTKMRWRTATWLVLLELVLGQGVLIKALSLAVVTVL